VILTVSPSLSFSPFAFSALLLTFSLIADGQKGSTLKFQDGHIDVSSVV